jgi:hypothetical protein
MNTKDTLKRVLKMSRNEYDFQQDWGMFWTLYPDTTGDYEEDMKQIRKELKEVFND